MLLLDRDRLPAGRTAATDPEALIGEARRRTRRRRLRAAIGAVVLVGAGVLAFFASSGGGSGIVAETAGRPFVDVNAFRRDGDLAFISRGALWLLDGGSGSLRRLPVPAGYAPASPVFSRDGRWLAYLATSGGPSQLWLARADGSGAHAVVGLRVGGLVGWSPRADVLAVVALAPGRLAGGLRRELPTVVDLISSAGTVRRLVSLHQSRMHPAEIEGALWSPNGRAIAVSSSGLPGGVSAVRTYQLGGGTPTTWFSIGTRQRLAGICGKGCGGTEVFAQLAGWWPGWGIAFWGLCCGATRNLDETPLFVVRAPGARPRLIAHTLSDGSAPIAGRSGGLLALVASTGGRDYGEGKVVEGCNVHVGRCAPVPGASIWTGPGAEPCVKGLSCPAAGTPGSAISIEPAWSPTAPLLAYVKAPYDVTDANLNDAWFGAHQLYVWNERTGATRRLATVRGVSVPTWSRDGRHLLYVSGDSLWLAPASGGTPVEIERPLFRQSEWNRLPLSLSYFGQIYWTGQFSWWSP